MVMVSNTTRIRIICLLLETVDVLQTVVGVVSDDGGRCSGGIIFYLSTDSVYIKFVR
jgi:hypothetical protein